MEAMENARGIVLAFMQGTHLRLGAGSLVFRLDSLLVRLIGEAVLLSALCNHACVQHLPYFLGNGSDFFASHELRDAIGGLIMRGDVLQGRFLHFDPDDPERSEDEPVQLSPMRSLADVVWEIRSKAQAMHDDDYLTDYTAFFELSEQCRLPRISDHTFDCSCMLYASDGLEALEDDDDEATAEHYPAHVLGNTSIAEHGQDVLDQLDELLQAKGEFSEEEFVGIMARWLTELLVLQACMFPVCNSQTKLSFCGEEGPKMQRADDSTGIRDIFLDICHENGEEVHKYNCRMSTSTCVSLGVDKKRRVVKIEYSYQDTSFCSMCRCEWCRTYEARRGPPNDVMFEEIADEFLAL